MQGAQSRAAGLAGILSAALIAVALLLAPALPGPTASAPDVYSFLLDEGRKLSAAVALHAGGLVLLALMLASLRRLPYSPGRGWAASSAFVFGLVAIGLACASLGLLGGLALQAEQANPTTARELLDSAQVLRGIAGPAFAAMLACAALTVRTVGGALPRRLSDLAWLAAAGCLLWVGRLFFETGPLAADAGLGSSAGTGLLIAWTLATGLWLTAGVRQPERPAGRDLPGP